MLNFYSAVTLSFLFYCDHLFLSLTNKKYILVPVIPSVLHARCMLAAAVSCSTSSSLLVGGVPSVLHSTLGRPHSSDVLFYKKMVLDGFMKEVDGGNEAKGGNISK